MLPEVRERTLPGRIGRILGDCLFEGVTKCIKPGPGLVDGTLSIQRISNRTHLRPEITIETERITADENSDPAAFRCRAHCADQLSDDRDVTGDCGGNTQSFCIPLDQFADHAGGRRTGPKLVIVPSCHFNDQLFLEHGAPPDSSLIWSRVAHRGRERKQFACAL